MSVARLLAASGYLRTNKHRRLAATMHRSTMPPRWRPAFPSVFVIRGEALSNQGRFRPRAGSRLPSSARKGPESKNRCRPNRHRGKGRWAGFALGLLCWGCVSSRSIRLGWLAVSGTRDDVTIRMKSQPQPTTQEVLAGPVERVTFHNDDSGFCVLRIKARGHRELITVIGHAAVISAGEWITASGEWINDRTHGQQFKAKFLKTSEPTSLDGIEKYLGSGMIRGIGPVYAKKLVRAFGDKVFDTIEAEPERLREVTGIGAVRASRITAAWADQKIIHEIMVFLHSNGVGTARAVRIFKTYGADAVQVMSENPYRLARDIRGIGFKTADAIAMKLGIEKTAMIRVRAGISFALTEAMDDGHCGLPTD